MPNIANGKNPLIVCGFAIIRKLVPPRLYNNRSTVNQNPRQADFVLGNCPQCQKVIRIPVTAVTSQSKSQVKCPICDAAFEIADVLEETIPEVEVIDASISVPAPAPESPPSSARPERINAIDTPDLFHVSKDGYQPTTEKKNGRFVVPELLSKGNKSKKKRKRSSSRRRRENDPKLAQSLAKLKENKTSLDEADGKQSQSDSSTSSSNRQRERSEEDSRRSRKHKESRSKSSSRNDGPAMKREETFGNWYRSLRNRIKTSRNFKSGTIGSKLELILIGIGLLLAIPILHLLLWWLMGIDPLGLAKPTSRMIPFLVPSSMRAIEEPEVIAPKPRAKDPIIERSPTETITRDPDGKLPKPKFDPSSIHSDDF